MNRGKYWMFGVILDEDDRYSWPTAATMAMLQLAGTIPTEPDEFAIIRHLEELCGDPAAIAGYLGYGLDDTDPWTLMLDLQAMAQLNADPDRPVCLALDADGRPPPPPVTPPDTGCPTTRQPAHDGNN
jgi:hypothetical protein